MHWLELGLGKLFELGLGKCLCFGHLAEVNRWILAMLCAEKCLLHGGNDERNILAYGQDTL